MDNDMKHEILLEINRFKKLLKSLENDGDITIRERNTIMKHMGAVKAVLYDTGLKESFARAKQRV